MEILLTQILEIYTVQISAAFLLLAILAFTVSVMTELIKNVGLLSRVPTDLLVIALSVALCMLTYLAYISYSAAAFAGYVFAGVLVFSFFVAFLAMYGWEKLGALWTRFIKGR